jgi:hypothetical protein
VRRKTLPAREDRVEVACNVFAERGERRDKVELVARAPELDRVDGTHRR